MIVVRRVRPGSTARKHSQLDPFAQAITGSGGRRAWRPPVEVFETDPAVEVVVEIAGMASEEIDIVIEGDLVSIQGTRKDACPAAHRLYHVANIAYGKFAVDLRIPVPFDADQAEASYTNGFLHLVLPRIAARTIVPTRRSVAQEDQLHDPS